MIDDYNVIGRSLFKKETNIQLFVGLKVHLSTGELGVIDSAFGQSGKFKIHIPGEYGYFLLLLVGTGKPWRDGRNSALTVHSWLRVLGLPVLTHRAQPTKCHDLWSHQFVARKPLWILEEAGLESTSCLSQG